LTRQIGQTGMSSWYTPGIAFLDFTRKILFVSTAALEAKFRMGFAVKMLYLEKSAKERS